MRILIAALLLAFCGLAYSAPDAHGKGPQGVGKEKADAPKANPSAPIGTSASKSITATVNPPVPAPNVDKKPDDAHAQSGNSGGHDHWGNKSEFWLFVATIVLCGVTAWLAWFTRSLYSATVDLAKDAKTLSDRQHIETTKSLDLARKEFDATHRPWISVGVSIAGPITYDVNGLSISLMIRMENLGSTPALNVFPNLRVVAPAIGVDHGLDLNGELKKLAEQGRDRPPVNWGYTVFPNEVVNQPMGLSIGNDELKRITEKVSFINVNIVGSVEYRATYDPTIPHQTGFIYEMRRSDRPRQEATEKNRSNIAIFVDEGDIPAEDLRLYRSLITGGHAT